MSDEAELNDLILAEFESGRSFLEKEGHPGSVLIASPPDQFGARMYELGARYPARPDRRAHAIIEIDPGRVGWRIEASLSICPDDRDSCETVDLGASRTVEREETASWAKVLARRAIVELRDYLDGANGSSSPGSNKTG